MTPNIDDVVESLVATSYALPGDYSVDPPRNICTEAADLIASLQAALKPFAEATRVGANGAAVIGQVAPAHWINAHSTLNMAREP